MQQRPNGRGTPPGFPHLRRLPLPVHRGPPRGADLPAPPAAAPPLPPRSSIPAAQRPQKAVSKMGGRPTACASIQQRHRTEGRKVGRQEEGPPLKSQMVDLDLASSEMARLAKVGTGPQCRRSAPRTHDHAQGRGLAVRPSKNASTAPVCGRNPPTMCAAADLAGRARSILPVCL